MDLGSIRCATGQLKNRLSPEHTGVAEAPKENIPDELAQRSVARRAIEIVMWGMPAVNFDLMHQALVKAKDARSQIVYRSRPFDWKNQTLTPNPTPST